MTTTPSGRLEPTPGLASGSASALDFSQALMQGREQARAQWADGLAQFQAQMGTVAEASMPGVVRAAMPAFALGFSFSVQKLLQEEQALLRVTLRHRGGAEEFSEAVAPPEGSAAWYGLAASLLAGLLGLPVGEPPRTIEPVQHEATSAPAAVSAVDSPSAVGENEAPDDEWTTAAPSDQEAVDPALEPLSEAEIDTLHKVLAAMPPEERKRFTIAFRHHFQVPREARTIKDRITQRRHKDFIDLFERELAGGRP